eukprot:5691691-Prymnesium_polylepis.1
MRCGNQHLLCELRGFARGRCAAFRDRFSASVINSRIRTTFSGGGGFVVSAENNRGLCAWAAE